MASTDLKDAFFTVPVHKLHQKCFMLQWIRKFYKFLGMPNGYSDAMRIFTKILKPDMDILDKKAICLSYLLMTPTYKGALSNNA